MNPHEDPVFPTRVGVRARQGDLGRDGAVSAIGVSRWLEDARLRVRLPRFERLLRAGGFRPFQILLVGQSFDRLAPVISIDADLQVHTGISRIGRSSFTFEQDVVADGGERVGSGQATVVLADSSGPLTLPDELSADLLELRLPDAGGPPPFRPGPERHRREHYRFFAPLRARIGDVDTNQHVNFIALATWYDEAVAAFTTHVLGTGDARQVPDLPPRSFRIQYLAEVTYPGDYDIGLAAHLTDGESVRYELGVFSGSRCLGVADAAGQRGELTAAIGDGVRLTPAAAP